jgi:hypothetical protein
MSHRRCLNRHDQRNQRASQNVTQSDAGNKNLEIAETVGARLANALMSGHPAAIAYIGADNRPRISHRGSLQRLNERQLAIWARNAKGGLVEAMTTSPSVAVLFSDFSDYSRRILFNCVGRGHVEPDEGVRRAVYESAPELERGADPGRLGVAVVIDVDEISGYVEGEYIQMRRD